jgi:hypothetical protein
MMPACCLWCLGLAALALVSEGAQDVEAQGHTSVQASSSTSVQALRV